MVDGHELHEEDLRLMYTFDQSSGSAQYEAHSDAQVNPVLLVLQPCIQRILATVWSLNKMQGGGLATSLLWLPVDVDYIQVLSVMWLDLKKKKELLCCCCYTKLPHAVNAFMFLYCECDVWNYFAAKWNQYICISQRPSLISALSTAYMPHGCSLIPVYWAGFLILCCSLAHTDSSGSICLTLCSLSYSVSPLFYVYIHSSFSPSIHDKMRSRQYILYCCLDVVLHFDTVNVWAIG